MAGQVLHLLGEQVGHYQDTKLTYRVLSVEAGGLSGDYSCGGSFWSFFVEAYADHQLKAPF